MTTSNPMGNRARNPSAHLPQIPVYPTTTQSEQPTQPDRFLRRREVIEITSLPSSTITDMVRNGKFPAPYKLTTDTNKTGRHGTSAWRLSEITAWMDSRPRAGGAA